MKRQIKAVLYPLVYRAGRERHDGGITVLSYHSVDECGTGISVSPRRFAAQMATLAAEGCPSFTMSQVAEYLAAGRPFPPRAVAVTFDDGFADVRTVAAPIMARYGVTGTVYVIAGMIGRVINWTEHGAPLPPLPILTWDQIRALTEQGIEIGAHSITHGFLTRYPPDKLRRELGEPRAVLEQTLGRPVVSFAYPQGDYNPAVVAATRAAGYTNATTIDQGRVTGGTDPFLLPRLHVGENTTPAVLRAFTVPTIGPAYMLINGVIRGVLGRERWPRPYPADIQSSETVPLPKES